MEKKYLKLLPWFCLIGLFCFLSVFMWNHVDYLIDSDMSSEMVLARLLAEENKLITPNWYYSTEIKILSTQLIYSFFFRIFHDWTIIRVLSCIVSYVILLISYYYLLRQMKYEKLFAISAIFFFMPLSDGYFVQVLLDLIYLPFIIISFLVVGMIFHYANASKNMKFFLLGASAILALFVGMGGARMVVVLYLPILAATILKALLERKSSDYLICAIVSFVVSGIGYLINSMVLSELYRFRTWNTIQWHNFSMEGIFNIFFGTLRIFGWSYGQIKTPVASGFSCVLLGVMGLCVLGNIFIKWKKPDTEWLLSSYIVFTFSIFFGMYTFTDMLYADRYAISVVAFALPVITISIHEVKWNRYLKLLLGTILIGGTLISSIFRYERYGKLDKTAEFRQIADYLVEKQEISEGYATYWNANVLTELSDGFIDVYAWEQNVDDLFDVNDMNPWLQEVDHEVSKPGSRIFLLFSNEEYDVCPLKNLLDEENIAFTSENYIIFIYESYEELLSKGNDK